MEVEFAPDRELLTLEVNPRDCFIATTSWTAHLAHRATEELDRERFVFVIQEYDPLTYPVGTLGAVTRQAYTFPHFAVFSTELLRDYFRNHSIGVFAEGAELGDERSVSFRNAITSVDPPSPDGMRRQAASLLFYARPEEHAERNMFELGLMAIARGDRRRDPAKRVALLRRGRHGAQHRSHNRDRVDGGPASPEPGRVPFTPAGTLRWPLADGHPPSKPRSAGDGLRGHVGRD